MKSILEHYDFTTNGTGNWITLDEAHRLALVARSIYLVFTVKTGGRDTDDGCPQDRGFFLQWLEAKLREENPTDFLIYTYTNSTEGVVYFGAR
jgi:hypothetical protein